MITVTIMTSMIVKPDCLFMRGAPPVRFWLLLIGGKFYPEPGSQSACLLTRLIATIECTKEITLLRHSRGCMTAQSGHVAGRTASVQSGTQGAHSSSRPSAAIGLRGFARRRPRAAELRPGDAGHRHRRARDLEHREGLAQREPGNHAGDRRHQV